MVSVGVMKSHLPCTPFAFFPAPLWIRYVVVDQPSWPQRLIVLKVSRFKLQFQWQTGTYLPRPQHNQVWVYDPGPGEVG